jgi:hypothetical protein
MPLVTKAERRRRKRAVRELAASTSAYQAAARPVVSRKPSPYKPKPEQKQLEVFGIAIPGSERRHTSGVGARALADLYHTAHDAPLGVAALGTAMYRDWHQPVVDSKAYEAAKEYAKKHGQPPPPKPKFSFGRYGFPRTRAIGKAAGQAFRDDIRHPLRHPGNTLLDVAGLVGGGIGLGVKGSAALRAAEGASKVRRLRVLSPDLHSPSRIAGSSDRNSRALGLARKRMVKQLRYEERSANPLIAAARELGLTRGIRTSVPGVGKLRKIRSHPIAGLTAVNISARRERAARELHAESVRSSAASRRRRSR